MADPQVLVVTSGTASSAAVVPVLAAIEAAGMRVRAIDVGGGDTVVDRVRRVFGGERRLRNELDMNPPDAAVVFDPHSALALTVARDQMQNPAPVIAVVGELEPAAGWGQTDADRFLAIDELAAVALADAGVEADRILIVGAIGERAFAEAGQTDRASLRQRFKLGGKVALVEVTGLGGEGTGQLAMQLSLLDGNNQITFLFDAAGDADAAAVLRRQVPALGLKAKLFGATADAALLWRAADVIVARPRVEVASRVLLVGGKLVAIVDDLLPDAAKTAASLETRRRAIPAKGLLLLASAIEAAFVGVLPGPTEDGGDNIADIVSVIAGDKRAVIDERRAAAHAVTRDRVRAANAAAQAAAATTAMPGELEDLGGGGGSVFDNSSLPDAAEVERLRGEVARRMQDMNKSMAAARDAATDLADKAKGATARGASDEAAQLDRRADAERAKMHAQLAELAQLESELKELERTAQTIKDAPPPPKPPRASSSSSTGSSSSSSSPWADPEPPPRRPKMSLEDELAALKRGAGPVKPGAPSPPKPSGSSTQARPSPPSPPSSSPASSSPSSGRRRGPANVDDELAALKKKMSNAPPKKKP